MIVKIRLLSFTPLRTDLGYLNCVIDIGWITLAVIFENAIVCCLTNAPKICTVGLKMMVYFLTLLLLIVRLSPSGKYDFARIKYWVIMIFV